MITAKQLPSGNWRCRVYVGKDASGKGIYKSVTKKTEKQCIKEALELQEHYREVAGNSGAMTLDEAIQDYISKRDHILSPATIRGYDQIRRNRFQPEMGRKVSKIKQQDWQTAINREAKTCSPKTLANAWGLISTITNEYCGVKYKVTLPQAEQFKGQALTASEAARLLHVVKGTDLEIPILLAVWLGLRRSEIIALKWKDYNSRRRTIHIHAAKVPNKDGVMVEKGTKTTASTRTLHVSEYLAEVLDSTPRKSEYIVALAPETIGKWLKRYCKKADVPVVRLHDLRHTNASFMLALKFPNKYSMKRGGWSNESTLRKVYQHTYSEAEQELDDVLNQFFEGLYDTKYDTDS